MTITAVPRAAAGLVTKRRRAELRERVLQHSRRRDRPAALRETAAVLREGHDVLGPLLVWNVLGWVPRLPEHQKRSILRHAGVHSDFRQVGELTERQVDLVATALTTPAIVAERNGTATRTEA